MANSHVDTRAIFLCVLCAGWDKVDTEQGIKFSEPTCIFISLSILQLNEFCELFYYSL